MDSRSRQDIRRGDDARMERETAGVHAILRGRRAGRFCADHAAGVVHGAERSADGEYDQGSYEETERRGAGERWTGVPVSAGPEDRRTGGGGREILIWFVFGCGRGCR